MSNVSLKSLLVPNKEVSVEFPGFEGFVLKLAHVSRDDLIAIRRKCTITKFNKRTHQPEDTLDDEKFIKEYCTAVIKGWSGLKFSYLEEFLLADTSSYDPEDCLPYTQENAETLLRNSVDFESGLQTLMDDIQTFTKSK